MNYSQFTEIQNCEKRPNLEPRLQEYIKKKKYYRENNIVSPVPIETQYMITDRDKKILNDYYKYHSICNEKYVDFVKPVKGQQFISDKYGMPNLDKIKKRMEKDKQARKDVNDFSQFKMNYDNKIVFNNYKDCEENYDKIYAKDNRYVEQSQHIFDNNHYNNYATHIFPRSQISRGTGFN